MNRQFLAIQFKRSIYTQWRIKITKFWCNCTSICTGEVLKFGTQKCCVSRYAIMRKMDGDVRDGSQHFSVSCI